MNKNTIILVSGKIHSGKDECSRIIKEELSSTDTIVHHEKFAQHLKEITSESFKPLMDELNEIFQDSNLWELVTKPENFFENKTLLSRNFLQIVGCLVRDIDPDYWIKHLAKVIHEKLQHNQMKDNVVVVSDWRFRNELSLIEYVNQYRLNYPDVNVKLVRISRPSVVKTIGANHKSEIDLDDFKHFDYHINNYGSLNMLRQKVKTMLSEFGLEK